MDDDTERRLVERLQRQDEAAFNELVRVYEQRVFALVQRMIGDRAEAEDLAQEVFVTVFKSIGSFRGESKLSTWLYRVTTNHCKNRIKYLGRRARPGKEAWDETEEGVQSATMQTAAVIPRPDLAAEGNQTEALVRRALAALPDDQRELVVLRDIEGLTYEEIQSITGLAEGTVKSKLHRARLALTKLLESLQKGGK
jgi:RNA polymerase sigma-70 factor, ECF subfamily